MSVRERECDYKKILQTLFFRYKRKGFSSLGLELGKQQVTWDDSNKKSKGGSKKEADRYFSTVSRQLLSSQRSVSALPVILESSDATVLTTFLPLGNDEENKDKETGRQRYQFQQVFMFSIPC